LSTDSEKGAVYLAQLERIAANVEIVRDEMKELLRIFEGMEARHKQWLEEIRKTRERSEAPRGD
jgi:DNA primase large subunit